MRRAACGAACWPRQAQVPRSLSGASISDCERGAGAHRQLYGIEQGDSRTIADERKEVRQARSRRCWNRCRLGGKQRRRSCRRSLTWRWRSVTRSIAGVRCYVFAKMAASRWITIAAERALRAVALAARTICFAGSDSGGERAAAIYSLLESAKLNGIDPETYLSSVLRRIADHPINRIAELLPWNLFRPRHRRWRRHDTSTAQRNRATIFESWAQSRMTQKKSGLAANRIQAPVCRGIRCTPPDSYLRFTKREVYRYFTFPA